MSLLGDTWDDPRTLGLLAAAQAMMQQRGVGGLLSGATVYGGALAQAKQAERKRQMEDEQRAAMAEDRAMRQQVQKLQFEDAARRRAAEEAMAKRGAMDEEVLRRTFAPMTGATANAGSGLIGPTNEAAAVIGQVPRFDPRSVLAMGGSFDALGKAMKINETMNPAPKLMSVAPGASVLDERNPGRGPVFTAPERPEKAPEALRTLAMIYGENSPQYVAAVQALGRKMTTHQPGVSVTYGAPVAGQDQSGNPVFFQPSKDGAPPSIVPGVRPPAKELPSGMAEKFAQNAVTLQKIDEAIELVSKNPSALGVKNYAPDAVIQRMDTAGVTTRALVADLAGQKIHDRSGAAVTVGEAARLRPYIPNATDDPDVARQKLVLFRREYAAMQEALATGAAIKQAAASGQGAADPSRQDRVRRFNPETGRIE